MDWVTELDRWAADYLPDVKITAEEPMARHTSFRTGGPARRMAFPENGEQLVLLTSFARECGARPIVIGNGTNLLAPDNGLDRLVIAASGLRRVETGPEPDTVLAEAGVTLAQAAEFACKRSLTGLEFAHGIPGTVGGAVYMNAGAYDGEMSQVIQEVSVLLPEEGVRLIPGGEMAFSYRHSLLADCPDAVLLYAVFRLTSGDPAAIREKMRELMARRKARQPLEYPSAGSTFKRPEGYFAGKLIMDAGLKGCRVGGAQVSEKHCGFVINRDHATAADIRGLMELVQNKVQECFGVWLEPEVKMVGEF